MMHNNKFISGVLLLLFLLCLIFGVEVKETTATETGKCYYTCTNGTPVSRTGTTPKGAILATGFHETS